MSPAANSGSSKTGIKMDLPYRIIQITDSHLGANRDQALLGINSYQSLELVVQLVEQERGQNFDRILGSGDISFDGSEPSYRDYLGLMERFERPISWLPGNHDCPEMMDSITDVPLLQQSRLIKLPDWQLVLLNSKTPEATGGQLQKQELALLEAALKQPGGKHSLVCLHHQPVAIGCDWMDPHQVGNADLFFEIIDRYPGTQVVLWGHIHQLFDSTRGHIRLLATPSTCHQFEPNQQQFKIGKQLPGYRWIDLYPNGKIDTGVSRIKSSPFEIEYRSKGY